MSETVNLTAADLTLDQGNARLGVEQESQQATYHALVKKRPEHFLRIAQDIVEFGLDPTNRIVVIRDPDDNSKHRVLEGNRRSLALKALETPGIVDGALSAAQKTRLDELSRRYLQAPLRALECVRFPNEEAARHWILLRHTGENGGAGTVSWNSNEQDRYTSRHGGSKPRKPAGQIIDFINEIDGAPDGADRIITTLERLLSTREVRDALGVEIRNGEVYSFYPRDQVARGIRKIIQDLRSQEKKVGDLYHIGQRRDYLKEFSAEDLPDPTTRLKDATTLGQLPTESAAGKPSAARGGKTKSPVNRKRTTVARKGAGINPRSARCGAILRELTTLEADSFPNAGAVLLRVFVELSVDHAIDARQLMTQQEVNNTPLAKRLKNLTEDMKKKSEINESQKRAIDRVANSSHGLAATIFGFNQYVHNEFSFPKASELMASWDELEFFLQKVWE